MSKGPGRWQQRLLRAAGGAVIAPVGGVVRACVVSPVRADYTSARRAARTMAEASRLAACYAWTCPGCFRVQDRPDPESCCRPARAMLAVANPGRVHLLAHPAPPPGGRPPSWLSSGSSPPRSCCGSLAATWATAGQTSSLTSAPARRCGTCAARQDATAPALPQPGNRLRRRSWSASAAPRSSRPRWPAGPPRPALPPWTRPGWCCCWCTAARRRRRTRRSAAGPAPAAAWQRTRTRSGSAPSSR